MTLLRKTSGPDSDSSVMGAGKAETRWQMIYSRTDSAPPGGHGLDEISMLCKVRRT